MASRASSAYRRIHRQNYLKSEEEIMSIDSQLASSMKNIPECLAAGYVDVQSGMLLAVKTVDSHPSEVLDLLAAATAELFQGPNVIAIEDIFKKSRGTNDGNAHYFQEMVVLSDNLVHVFMRGKTMHEQIAAFVCRKSVNLGMALTKARMEITKLEAAL